MGEAKGRRGGIERQRGKGGGGNEMERDKRWEW